MTKLPTNVILTNEISSYDTQGSIIWYPIEFGLILINNINPRSDLIKKHNYTNAYQAVHDLHEQKSSRNC
jgi:hypothetical protein